MRSEKRKISIRRMKNTEKDMNTLLKWLSEPKVLEWWGAEEAPWDLDKVTKEFGDMTHSWSKKAACFILLDEMPVGYVQYYPIGQDSYKFNDEETYNAVKGGYGLDMFIGEPTLWGQGIGKKAVKALEKQLSDELQVDILCVDPERENKRAVHFWKKAGFTPISFIKNYDDDNKESILMVRRLHSSDWKEKLTVEEAKELIAFQSGRCGEVYDIRWQNGFLGMLRPLRGELLEDNFIEIMECLDVLKGEFQAEKIDKNLVSDLVSIIHLTRGWADPEGMLGRNKLLTDEETRKLFIWIDIIEECLMYLLEGVEEEAFWAYNEYLDGRYI